MDTCFSGLGWLLFEITASGSDSSRRSGRRWQEEKACNVERPRGGRDGREKPGMRLGVWEVLIKEERSEVTRNQPVGVARPKQDF